MTLMQNNWKPIVLCIGWCRRGLLKDEKYNEKYMHTPTKKQWPSILRRVPLNKRVWGSILHHFLACRWQSLSEIGSPSVGASLVGSSATYVPQVRTFSSTDADLPPCMLSSLGLALGSILSYPCTISSLLPMPCIHYHTNPFTYADFFRCTRCKYVFLHHVFYASKWHRFVKELLLRRRCKITINYSHGSPRE